MARLSIEHAGFTGSEIERGVHAAIAVLAKRGIATEVAHAAMLVRCEEEPEADPSAADAWEAAETAAVQAAAGGGREAPLGAELVLLSDEIVSPGSGSTGARMSSKELQAARKLLMLDVSEAAELIGNVSSRSWQYWESGRNAVPVDVSDEMHALLSIRAERVEAIAENLADNLALPFYPSYEQFVVENPGQNRVQWRLSQSVAALFYTDGLARLI